MKKHQVLVLLLSLLLLLSSCRGPVKAPETKKDTSPQTVAVSGKEDLLSLSFLGAPFVTVGDNTPFFTAEEITSTAYESYAPLDALGRCGAAIACIGQELMPTEDREGIGQIKPSGWQTVKYDVVDGKYLYNRCHLIGFQLTGENANEENLITGTRYLNVEGMLPFENMVADFIKETGNHVMYRVTPLFSGEELVARGVLMEAVSVEDSGEGIRFCVYCFNAQPSIEIDYQTGDSRLSEEKTESGETSYILNTNSKKIHQKTCSSVSDMAPQNRKETTLSLKELEQQGYVKCKSCF